jgi:hypothetical protein
VSCAKQKGAVYHGAVTREVPWRVEGGERAAFDGSGRAQK